MPERLVADKMLTPSVHVKVVTRPFNAAGRDRYRGEVVEVGEWRNVSVLQERRYLADLPYGASPIEVEIDGNTVKFLNDEAALAAMDKLAADKACQTAQEVPVGAYDHVSGMDVPGDGGDALEGLTAGLTDNVPIVTQERPTVRSGQGQKR